MSNNSIANLDTLKTENLPSLSDLTLENNPVEKILKFSAMIKEKFPTVLYLNLQKMSVALAKVAPTEVS